MTKQEHETTIGQRVRLKKDGQDALYEFAAAGSVGWVRDHTHDSLGFPMVFIEWDKDHWAYNGEPNRWTFESHFEPEEKESEDVGEEQKFTPAQFAEALSKLLGTPEDSEPTQLLEQPDQDVDQEYADALARGVANANDADSFLLITVGKEDLGAEVPVLAPRVVNYYKNEESGLVLETVLSKLAAQSHEQVSLAAIRALFEDREES